MTDGSGSSAVDSGGHETTGSLDGLGDVLGTATGWLLSLVILVTAVQHLLFPELVAPAGSTAYSRVFEFDPHRPLQWWRWVTSVFAHGDAFHLLANVVLLRTFGPQVESRLGRVGTLGVFLAGATAGHLALVASAATGFYGPTVLGASGGALGLFAWLSTAVPYADARLPGSDVTFDAWVGLAAVAGGTVVVMVAFGPGAFGIDHVGHLGGMAAGAALGVAWRGSRGDA